MAQAATPAPAMGLGRDSWIVRNRSLLIAGGLIIVILIVAGIRHPGFVSFSRLRNQLVLSSFLGVAAAGQTILILTGGIDLSAAWNLNFSAILMTQLAG